jgi:hypothetical protein
MPPTDLEGCEAVDDPTDRNQIGRLIVGVCPWLINSD